MPTPDVSEYLGLELVQLDEPTLIERALAHLVETFPDYVPRPGNTEYVLIEAIAGITAELGYAINTLPDGLTEVLLRLFGLERDQGSPPTASVKFTLNDTVGHTIPDGTTVRLDLGDDEEPVDFTTIGNLVIPPGQFQGTVTAGGSVPTLEANGAPAGTALEVVDAIRWINSAELAATANGGREAEDGDAFLDRATPILRTLTTTLVRAADVERYVKATYADAKVVRVLDSGRFPAFAPGTVFVVVGGVGGSSLGQPRRLTIGNDLIARMAAGMVVYINDVILVGIDVDVEVTTFPGANPATVEAAIRATLADYLRPESWWSGSAGAGAALTLLRNELIARVDAVPGVNLVTALSIVTTAPNAGIGTVSGAGDVTFTSPIAAPQFNSAASVVTITAGT